MSDTAKTNGRMALALGVYALFALLALASLFFWLNGKVQGLGWGIAMAALVLAILPLPFVMLSSGGKGEAGTKESGSSDKPQDYDALLRLLHSRRDQLIHAGRLVAMGEMTPGLAHELNQPLCVIRGYLELLQAVLSQEPILKERQLDGAFDICIKSVDKASKIINHMRAFVVAKGSVPKAVNLRSVIEEGLCFFNEQIKQHNIKLDMEFEDSMPEVLIDPKKFEQIVVNLVANARYSVDERGAAASAAGDRNYKKHIVLKLSCDKASDKVLFEVSDNGAGMSKEAEAACGTPFFTTKKPGEGTGLGVSIIQEIAKECDASFSFKNTPGEGCSFSALFPKAPQAVPPSPGATAKA